MDTPFAAVLTLAGTLIAGLLVFLASMIREYLGRLGRLEDRIRDLEKANADLLSSKIALERQLAEKDIQIADLQSEIAELRAHIRKLEHGGAP